MMRTAMLAACVAALLGSAASAQIALDPKNQYTIDWNNRLSTDWPYLARYAQANAALVPNPKHPRIVFMGDSITENWAKMAGDFLTGERIGRGISGQTTPQMLGRFRQDVIDLHPAVVQIMGGTNDIAGNTGPMTAEQTEDNIRSMVELAHAHGIRVILASIPPSSHFAWRPGLEVTHRIEVLNAWLKDYAAKTGSIYADYWSVLEDGKGGFRAAWTIDGVHPNRIGFDHMIPVARKAIAEAMSKPAPASLAIAGR